MVLPWQSLRRRWRLSEKNANNLTKSGTITPVVDFQHLREVAVCNLSFKILEELSSREKELWGRIASHTLDSAVSSLNKEWSPAYCDTKVAVTSAGSSAVSSIEAV